MDYINKDLFAALNSINSASTNESLKQLRDILGSRSDDHLKLNVKVINKSKNPFPVYEYKQASGFDLMADLDEDVVLKSNQRYLVPTGLYVELPHNTELQVRSRSGLAIKNGISVLNSPGTVDADYRGEIKVILHNSSDTDFTISNGMKIAQAVIAPVHTGGYVNLINTDNINETQRGSNGFGSTGV